jgi:hypothetical protein
MREEEKEMIINLYDNFLYSNSSGSFRPRERSINIEDAINELKNILYSYADYNWHDASDYPEILYKDIIVLDKDGKEHDNHYWIGHRYYQCCGEDGYPSDVYIVRWRYKDNQ